jgi:hypothetical protein
MSLGQHRRAHEPELPVPQPEDCDGVWGVAPELVDDGSTARWSWPRGRSTNFTKRVAVAVAERKHRHVTVCVRSPPDKNRALQDRPGIHALLTG